MRKKCDKNIREILSSVVKIKRILISNSVFRRITKSVDTPTWCVVDWLVFTIVTNGIRSLFFWGGDARGMTDLSKHASPPRVYHTKLVVLGQTV